MELNPPSFIQGVATETAAEARLMLAGLVPVGGVVAAGDLSVSQKGTPNMSVDITAGGCFIKGTESSTQGVYHCFNDATKNVVIAAADATNPRRDLVIAKVQDAFYSGGTNAWSLAVVTGTPAGSPVDPTPPANSITLARVAVPALGASVINAWITDLRGTNVTAMDNLRVLGAGSVNVVGSAAPAVGTGRFVMQAGSLVGGSSAGGDIVLSYPVPFPNGIGSVVVSFGDLVAAPWGLIVDLTGSNTLSQTYVRLYNTSTGAAVVNSAAFRMNWMAFGW